MIDTVVLNVQGLDCSETKRFVDLLRQRQGYAIAGKKVNPEFFKTTAGTHSENAMNILFNEATGKSINTWLFKKLPSSTYEVVVYVDFENRNKIGKGNVRINISLPKYKYGHNLKLLYLNPIAKTIEGNYRDGYDAFVGIIKGFFQTDLGLTPQEAKIVYRRTLVERLDFCHNHHFRTEEEAMYVLSLMRNIRPKNMRIETARFSDYATTLFFATQMHSKKVYLKGKEFRKTTRSKMQKAGFNVEAFQEIANRIMRFEITNRAAALTYYMRREHIKRFDLQYLCDLSEDLAKQEIYKAIDDVGYNVIRKILLVNSVPVEHKIRWRRIDMRKKAVKWLMENIYYPSHRKIEFYLRDPNEEVNQKNIGNMFYWKETDSVTPEMFKVLARNLESFINDMRPQIVISDGLEEKVRVYSEIGKRFTDNEMYALKMFSKQTIRNYRCALKKCQKETGEFYEFVLYSDFIAV